MTSLTQSEIASYRERGFVVPQYRLPAPLLSRLRGDLDAIVAAHPTFRETPLTSAHMPVQDSGLPSLMPFCRLPEILDMAESLEGPDLILWTTTVFHRPAREGGFTDWHQDGEFWPIRPLAGTSVWVAVSRCTVDNGCLRVIPGSHLSHAAHEPGEGFFSRVLSPGAIDPEQAVDVVLEPGQMILFDAELVHGSHPNRSAADRTGFVMRYLPTTSVFELDGGTPNRTGRPPYADRALFLVRGTDRAGNDLSRNHW